MFGFGFSFGFSWLIKESWRTSLISGGILSAWFETPKQRGILTKIFRTARPTRTAPNKSKQGKGRAKGARILLLLDQGLTETA